MCVGLRSLTLQTVRVGLEVGLVGGTAVHDSSALFIDSDAVPLDSVIPKYPCARCIQMKCRVHNKLFT